jgi:membrane-associated HD superfamily phosphohydrolase
MASIASESHTIFNKGVFDYLSERRISYIDQALADNAGSLISKQVIEANTISMLKASPKALFDSLLQPVPGQWHKLSAFIAFIENLLILFAILFAFIYKKPKLSYKNLIYFLLIFALIYMLIIGLSIPVAGAIVRYKIFASLFLMLMALLILDTRKLPLASNKP